MFIFIKNAHLEIFFNFYVTLKKTGKMQIFIKRINMTADFGNFVPTTKQETKICNELGRYLIK